MLYSLLITILLPAAIFALECLPLNFEAEYSIKNFNFFEFQNSLQALRPSNRYGYCGVQIVVKDLEQVLQIRSIKNPIRTNLEHKAVLQFSIKLNRNKNPAYFRSISLERHFSIKCETDDRCDAAFILRFLPTLLAENYQHTLNLAVPLFLEESGQSDSCEFYQANTIPCNTGVCYVHYSTGDTTNYVECANNSNEDIRAEYNWETAYVGGHQLPGSGQNNIVLMYYIGQSPNVSFIYVCRSHICSTEISRRALIETDIDLQIRITKTLLPLTAEVIMVTKPSVFIPPYFRDSLVNLRSKSSNTMGSSINKGSTENAKIQENIGRIMDDMQLNKV